MWRRLYLCLVLVRLYFALSPSYIHPDEHFQGPEIIAGEVFGYPSYKTWEFTSSQPIRSIFPFWLIYGWPLTVLKWIWEGLGYGPVPPSIAFYTLRLLMFLLSFILGDWAIHELIPAINQRRTAIILVASSYVTWTFQTHTFSNSIETLVVLWSLVLIIRLRDNIQDTQASASGVLAFLGVLGVFNRITFPAFLVIPLAQIVPGLYYKPLRIPVMLFVGLFTLAVAITMDTEYYSGRRPHLRGFHNDAVITPWNNLVYNADESNLAKHGLHPFWQHFVANLPQLIGPAIPLLFFSSTKNTLFWSGVGGIAIISAFRHQEPRFLLPAVPLLLSSIKVPRRGARWWAGLWVLFNVLAGTLFGVYHQGGAVPSQTWISQQHNIESVVWWKTYSPPRWLLDGKNHEVTTTDLMGMPGQHMIAQLEESAACESAANGTLLVAPSSATFLDAFTGDATQHSEIVFTRQWQYSRHIGLDDLDFGDDGVWPTLQRVIGRRGLTIWRVSRQC
ncbi:glycosyltransferase family 22 protein [Zasmidium cellare ATCC 36951]|uniref:Mannosyltransferase n=1 Tax=Zasmidium cellare ATCC 36951 TaxID=1080233 RepID=A0A6A6C0Y9_ZASCE|nr:glycosyltransferase family 22 protein [Zasmidium cellare ATCC 36951]KAF2160681.1 glycosyltransferase family 22 protein [Zasmidium cellare ATCC 36951]